MEKYAQGRINNNNQKTHTTSNLQSAPRALGSVGVTALSGQAGVLCLG